MRWTALRVFITLACAATAFGGFGDMVSSFPHPGGVGLYGLAWDGSYLWFAGQPASVFLRTNTTGSIVGSFDIGATYTYIRGLTFDGAYLWYSWGDIVMGYHYNRTTTTGSFVGCFGGPDYPGVAYDSTYLWCGPAKFTTGGSFVASFRRPFKMETDQGWYGHKLWLGGPGNHMYNVTTRGSVAASFPVPGGGAAEGTAFDGEYLWVINRDNKWVYRIDIDVVAVDPASMGKVKAIYR
jgi:hypothetical protein